MLGNLITIVQSLISFTAQDVSFSLLQSKRNNFSKEHGSKLPYLHLVNMNAKDPSTHLQQIPLVILHKIQLDQTQI